jgi:hypothetical protein
MTRAEILDKAKEYITKDRNSNYGNPEDNFGIIATFWSSYLRTKMPDKLMSPISTGDVAAMMILVKVARILSSPKHPDHWVDIAGYAGCGGQCMTEKKND